MTCQPNAFAFIPRHFISQQTTYMLCSRYLLMNNFFVTKSLALSISFSFFFYFSLTLSLALFTLLTLECKRNTYTENYLLKISFFSKSLCALCLLNSSLTTKNRSEFVVSLEISGTNFCKIFTFFSLSFTDFPTICYGNH